MTIYDAAPAIFAVVISVTAYVWAKITHERLIATRDARRAQGRSPAE